MYVKFGKSLIDVLYRKDGFISDDEKYNRYTMRINDIYRQQPLRKICKVCNHNVENEEIYFTSSGVEYALCGNCGNLNGVYEETLEFCNKIYVEDDYGWDFYDENEEAFLRRVHSVFEPKAKFLVDSLNLMNEDTYSFKYLDAGAGCGQMVCALRAFGLSAHGYDLSPYEVKYGNKLLKGSYLKTITDEETFSEIANTEANIISFINVLEHVRDLKGTLAAIKKNKNIKYIFFNVPVFSLSCIFEILHQNYYNRQLGGSHTHLFTKSSLEWIYKEYAFTPVAAWSFGQDVLDLRRFIALELQSKGASAKLINHMLDYFKLNGDELQLVVDHSGFSSEIHVIAKNG